ncbi:MAG: hypothetical protein KAI73_11120, partial [Rhodospirillaceae bacterium]|nr:hypothetical protein [Rhodospirillaceae bacterium]
DIASWLPGYAAMEGVRLGSEAGRLWDNGRHGRAVVTMGDAIEAPMDELWWFLPGAGIVRKLK